MPFRSKSIVREIGAALAVVTIYMLVLLMPLHQAAGLQRDLAGLGFENLETWSICSSIAQDDGQPVAAVKCAAAGIGKNEIVPPDVVHTALDILRVAGTVRYFDPADTITPAPRRSPGQPRAPPVAV